MRVAAGKAVAAWFDVLITEGQAGTQGRHNLWTGDDGGVMWGFVNFLTLFDVVGPGEAIATDAVLSIFVTRPELLDVFVFDGELDKRSSITCPPQFLYSREILAQTHTRVRPSRPSLCRSLPQH